MPTPHRRRRAPGNMQRLPDLVVKRGAVCIVCVGKGLSAFSLLAHPQSTGRLTVVASSDFGCISNAPASPLLRRA